MDLEVVDANVGNGVVLLVEREEGHVVDVQVEVELAGGLLVIADQEKFV